MISFSKNRLYFFIRNRLYFCLENMSWKYTFKLHSAFNNTRRVSSAYWKDGWISWALPTFYSCNSYPSFFVKTHFLRWKRSKNSEMFQVDYGPAFTLKYYVIISSFKIKSCAAFYFINYRLFRSIPKTLMRCS